MSIEAIGAVTGASLGNVAAPAPLAKATEPGAFDSLVSSLQGMSNQMVTNQQSLQSLAVGDTDELHRVIMTLESTKLTFDLAMQVRNKVLDAYQELMRIQM